MDLAFGEPGGGARFTLGIKLKADKAARARAVDAVEDTTCVGPEVKRFIDITHTQVRWWKSSQSSKQRES